MSEKKISVIVPVYNVETYIRKSIESILAQTYRNLEIILVDDGATDSSGEICEEYARTDERIQVIHKENGGLSDARNAGVAAATGDYIGFVDSDDFITPYMYQLLAAALEEGEADIAICSFETVDADGTPIPERSYVMPVKDDVISGEDAIRHLCGPDYTVWVTAWNRLYRSELAKQVSFPKGKIHEDEYSAHYFYALANRVAGVSKACYKYVVREESIMTRKYDKRNLAYVEALDGRIHYCLEHPQLMDVGLPFLRWMLKYLMQAYKKLDMRDPDTKAAYQESVRRYRKTYQEVKKQYSPGMLCVVGTAMLCCCPGIAAIVAEKVMK